MNIYIYMYIIYYEYIHTYIYINNMCRLIPFWSYNLQVVSFVCVAVLRQLLAEADDFLLHGHGQEFIADAFREATHSGHQ